MKGIITMEKDKKKGGAGRIVLIVLAVIAAMGAAGYFGLRALIMSKMDEINSVSLATTRGQEAPDFALPLTDGSEAKLSELLQDKEVVVLNIFASWCGPCKEEFPDMEKTYQKYKDKMEIVAVTGDPDDTMDDMAKYKEEHGLSFSVGLKNESIDSLKVGGFPTTYVIDRNGKIVFSQSRTALLLNPLIHLLGDGLAHEGINACGINALTQLDIAVVVPVIEDALVFIGYVGIDTVGGNTVFGKVFEYTNHLYTIIHTAHTATSHLSSTKILHGY